MLHKRLRCASALALVAGCAMLTIPLSAAAPAAAATRTAITQASSPASLAAAATIQAARAAAGTLPAASPAATHPPAFNEKTQMLTGSPTTKNVPSCVSRSITLIAAFYSYSEIIGGAHSTPKSVIIPAGTYGWTDCLIPQNGFYLQQSRVVDSNGNIEASINGDDQVATGTYKWGSELVIS
jgi:hypothetical protein